MPYEEDSLRESWERGAGCYVSAVRWTEQADANTAPCSSLVSGSQLLQHSSCSVSVEGVRFFGSIHCCKSVLSRILRLSGPATIITESLVLVRVTLPLVFV